MATLDRPKVDVMAEMAAGINPRADIRRFPAGVTAANLDAFLEGVDVYVDSIDFFAIEARRMVFAACHARGIPALTAAPLGMGVSMLVFDPAGMSFEDYFRLEGHDVQEQYARFIAGLSPAMLQRHYLVAPEAVNFAERRGPSTMMSVDLCAGVMGTEVLKVVLRRGACAPGTLGDAIRRLSATPELHLAPVRQCAPFATAALAVHQAKITGLNSDLPVRVCKPRFPNFSLRPVPPRPARSLRRFGARLRRLRFFEPCCSFGLRRRIPFDSLHPGKALPRPPDRFSAENEAASLKSAACRPFIAL